MAALVELLRPVLASHADVRLAVLFGSGARGELRRGSDVDLAVVWSDVSGRRDAIVADLERAAKRTFDLVDLSTAPPQLRFEIARDGVLLVEREPGAWGQVRARAFVDWWDFAPIARKIHRAAIERLARTLNGPA